MNKMLIEKGEILKLSDSLSEKYNQYLKERRQYLLEKIKDLYFPEYFANLMELLSLVEARDKKFPNRHVHYNFLKKIHANLCEKDQLELKELTNNFEFCIPADLPTKTDGELWDFRMLGFIWERPWVKYQEQFINLPTLIQRFLNLEFLDAPELFYWSHPYPDAGYSSRSSLDKKFIESNEKIKNLFEKIQDCDVNNLNSFGQSPNQFMLFAKEDTLSFIDVFIEKKGFYFSSSWGPADMVDILIHEYGHIHFDLKHKHFSEINGEIVYNKSRVHDEACAETLSWILLRSLYTEFPEIEFSHLLKQYAFSMLRPLDPHYVGAGATHFIFNNIKNAPEEYEKLTDSTDFKSYVENKGEALILEGINSIRTFTINDI